MIWRLAGVIFLSCLFHSLGFNLQSGVLRFEFPFFFAIAMGILYRPMNGLLVLLASLTFDILDHDFSSTPAHVIIYLTTKRFKRFLPVSHIPAFTVFAISAGIIDRLIYGILYGVRLGEPVSYLIPSLMNMSIFLTALLVTFGTRIISEPTGGKHIL